MSDGQTSKQRSTPRVDSKVFQLTPRVCEAPGEDLDGLSRPEPRISNSRWRAAAAAAAAFLECSANSSICRNTSSSSSSSEPASSESNFVQTLRRDAE